MKKKTSWAIAVLCVAFTFAGAITTGGCVKSAPYEEYVSDSRTDIYTGEIKGKTVTAYYGFTAENGEKIYRLTFILPYDGDGIKRTVAVLNEKATAEFSVDPVTDEYRATIETLSEYGIEFTATVSYGGNSETTVMRSVLPADTLSLTGALSVLKERQSELISLYCGENGFNGEIIAKVFVKDGKAFWYIGLKGEDGNLKALLIDGKNGEILATRDIK